VFANQVHDAPSAISLLDMPERERRHLGPPQSTTQQDCQDRAITQSLLGAGIGGVEQPCACFTESQFPSRTPLDATPFTRVIPFANSGASKPLSAASTASLRTAVIRTLMETAPKPRASSTTRQAATVALVKPACGSRPYQLKNSSRPRLYTRRVIGEETLSRTRDFSRCHSAARSANPVRSSCPR
jgi:hypothetical protein